MVAADSLAGTLRELAPSDKSIAEKMYSKHAIAATGGNMSDLQQFHHSEDKPYKIHKIVTWAAMNVNANSRFFGFDSFEGLPSDWNALHRKGAFGTGGRIPDIRDRRVEVVKGWFHKSLPAFLADFKDSRQLVVHIDSDLYASALCVLTTLDRWLIPGSIVIFDEFRDLLNEFAAWCDYCTAYWREAHGICFTPRYRKVALLMK